SSCRHEAGERFPQRRLSSAAEPGFTPGEALEDADAGARTPMKHESILVVDDEAGVRGSLVGILGDEGYAVEAVESGEAALTALESRRYDLILLDVWLPGMDGLEGLARVRPPEPERAVATV